MSDRQNNLIKLALKSLLLIGSTYAGIWVLLDSIGVKPGIDNVIISGAFAILLSLLFLSMNYNVIEKKSKYYIHPENIEYIKDFLQETKELKIFSSGSGGYRVKIQMMIKKMKNSNLKTIKILIRDDGTPERNIKIEDQIRQWEYVIKKPYSINIEYYRYPFSNVALRGYIFDDKYALLGWYYNDGEYRHGNDKILVLYSSEYKDQKEIIDFANETFDNIIKKQNCKGSQSETTKTMTNSQ